MWNKGDVPDSCTQPKRNGVGGPWYGHVCGLKVQWAARAYRVCVAVMLAWALCGAAPTQRVAL